MGFLSKSPKQNNLKYFVGLYRILKYKKIYFIQNRARRRARHRAPPGAAARRRARAGRRGGLRDVRDERGRYAAHPHLAGQSAGPQTLVSPLPLCSLDQRARPSCNSSPRPGSRPTAAACRSPGRWTRTSARSFPRCGTTTWPPRRRTTLSWRGWTVAGARAGFEPAPLTRFVRKYLSAPIYSE